jgi:hypothetical protein
MAYTSTLSGRNGFWQILRSEWTKFWSVPAAWVLVVLAVFGGSLFLMDLDQGPTGAGPGYHVVHRSLSGDGTMSARVVDHDLGHPVGALAGIIVTGGLDPSEPYVALFVTPDRGTWMHSFRVEIRGSRDATTPRWLRLTRTGGSITGYESTDGRTWSEIGTIRLRGLPDRVEVGLITVGGFPGTIGAATFDDATVVGNAPVGPWTLANVGTPTPDGASLAETDGVLTMRGTVSSPPWPRWSSTTRPATSSRSA